VEQAVQKKLPPAFILVHAFTRMYGMVFYADRML